MSITLLLFLALLVVSLVRILGYWILSIAYNFQKVGAVGVQAKVSVIVPAFNEEKSIASTIESLLKQDHPETEVVVVDDGSTDGTLEVARKYEGGRVRVVHQENRGKAEALNSGIRSSTGTLVLTVDADTRLDGGAVRHIAERFAADERLGSVAGNVKVDRASGLLQRLQAVEYVAGIGLLRKGQSMLGAVMIVPGPVAAFRKEAVERVGCFSGETFAEDFDITLAVLKAHYRVEYDDRSIAYTIAPRGVEDLLKQRRRWYRGMIQVLAKHEGMFMRRRYGVAGLYGIPWMWFDTVSPLINLFLVIFAVLTGYLSGQWATILWGFGVYWVMQTLAVLSAISFDKGKRLWQALISPLLIFYNTFLDGVRLAAFVEEMLTLSMKWEKPRR